MSDLLLTEVRNRVAYVVLNRPEKRNALSAALDTLKPLRSLGFLILFDCIGGRFSINGLF